MSYAETAGLYAGAKVVGDTSHNPIAESVAQCYTHLCNINERLQNINRRLTGGNPEKNPAPHPVASHLRENLLMCQQEISSIENWVDKITHDLFGE